MAGLLDMVNDPRQAFLTNLGMGLLSAGGPSARPVSLGQAFGAAMPGALQGAQQAQSYQAQVEEARRKQEAEQRRMQALSTMPPEFQQAVAIGAPVADVWKQFNPEAKFESYFDPTSGQERKGFIKPGAEPMPVGGAKGESLPPGMRMGVSGPEWIPGYLQGKKEVAKAGASNISQGVQFPKEQFKNERDLRNDFQGLPTTKAFKEVQTAYDQINTALANPSPANDLAAATKFMKMLDPGSVVRESELGMAMAATGLSDRVINYADMIIKGTKLTPSQRNDFAAASAELYRAAQGRFNETAGEYQAMAKDYGLNPERITKVSKDMPKSRFFDVDGKKVAAKLEADGNYYVMQNGKRYLVEE